MGRLMTWVPAFAARSADKSSSLDVEALFARCLGNPSFCEILLAEFEETGLVHVETIAMHLAQEDFRAVARDARLLQGAADILAAGAIQTTAQQIEEACVTYRHAAVAPLAERLRREMDVCLAELPAVRERIHELAHEILPA